MGEDGVAALPYPRVVDWGEGEHTRARAAQDARALVTQHYLAFRRPVFKFVQRRVRSEADAEELTQEIFLRLYVHVRDGNQVHNARAWIYAVARNAVADRQREYRDDPLSAAVGPIDLPSRADGVDHRFERLCREAQVEAAIASLPPLQRQCVALRADGMRLREVAATLDCTISTVASSLRRAVTTIRRRLADDAGPPERGAR